MWVTPSGCLFHLFELPLLVIISQLSWSMKDGQRPIKVTMNPYLDPDVMAAILICGDLEFHPLKADAVVCVDRSFILFTEDVIKIFSHPGDER